MWSELLLLLSVIFFFDVLVNAILGGTSMRVIDTPFGYYLTWHREKNRGTEFKPRVVLLLLPGSYLNHS